MFVIPPTPYMLLLGPPAVLIGLHLIGKGGPRRYDTNTLVGGILCAVGGYICGSGIVYLAQIGGTP